MKTKSIFLILALASLMFASERIVVAEDFMRVTCPYCPGAARGLRENFARSYDSLIVIAVHTAAPFLCTDGSARISYYAITGVPTVKFDGIVSTVGGVSAPGTMYPTYLHQFTARAAINSPLDIDLDCTYDTVSNTGSITATIENTSGSMVSGTLQFSVIENAIPYNWGGGLTTVEHVLRDMLPDAAGESVSIPSSDTIVRSRGFTIDAAWNEKNCTIVVFVQASSKEIYQGAEIDIIKEQNIDYYGLTLTELSGNGNGVAEPGEQIRMFIKGKNNGTDAY
ncbi:Omp28-related outer membrane protein, partial [candidate division WOR-3 bacterium]|nr:Omp28-related outer membrane protein [candidate division WOR-3 bacterium]